ncbi:MAG: Rap1a/Tai family immunity protein [Chromatiales bacterium]
MPAQITMASRSFKSMIVFTSIMLAISATLAAQEGEEMEPQFPQQQSAGDLLRACASSRLTSTGRERRRYCAGFVSGVEEAIRLLGPQGKPGIRICTPPDVTASALAKAFVKYGARHEGDLRDPAASVVQDALASAYPCSEQSG